MFNYKKFSLPMIFTTFFSYSTHKTKSPCANSRYTQCLNCFSYLLQAVGQLCLEFKPNLAEMSEVGFNFAFVLKFVIVLSVSQYSILAFANIAVIPLTAYLFLPVLYPLRLTSAYEYLELRFNKGAACCSNARITILMDIRFYVRNGFAFFF